VKGAMSCGYDRARDGRLSLWLFDHLGYHLTLRKATEDWRFWVARPGYALTEEDQQIVRALARKDKK
jgi:hypothetical protein